LQHIQPSAELEASCKGKRVHTCKYIVDKETVYRRNSGETSNTERVRMSKSNSGSSSGIGFLGLLTIVFIVLKLISVIDWSWWVILLPMYYPILVGLLVAIIYLICKLK